MSHESDMESSHPVAAHWPGPNDSPLKGQNNVGNDSVPPPIFTDRNQGLESGNSIVLA